MLHLTLLFAAAVATADPGVTLSGTVLDADGKPVAETIVVVAEGPPALRFMKRMARTVVPKAADVLTSARVDDSGKFAIAMPEEAPEFAWRRTRLSVWAYHPGMALSVRLIDRDWPQAGLLLSIKLARAAPARLKIVDADGQPLAGARVRPQRVADQPVPDFIAEQLTAISDAEGLVNVGGLAAVDLDAVIIESEACGRQWVGLPRVVGNHPTTIALAPVGRLTGRLMADDPRAARHRKLRLATWLEPDDETSGGGLAEAVTDDDGLFDVPAIAAGSLTFEAAEGLEASGLGLEKNLPAPSPHPLVPPVYLAEQTTGPAVEAGKTMTLKIPLRRAVLVTQNVRDREDGAPIAGVRVSLNWGIPGSVSGISDTAGNIHVHVLPGNLTPMPIGIPRPFYNPKATYPGESIGESNEVVTIDALRLALGATVRGRLLDAENHPLAGAEVIGLSPLPPRSIYPLHAWTNEAGEFTIAGVPPDVPARLWFSHRDAASVEAASVPPQDQPAVVVVGNEHSVSIEGRVLDDAQQPVAGASVRIWLEQRYSVSPSDNDEIELGSGRTTPDGSQRRRTSGTAGAELSESCRAGICTGTGGSRSSRRRPRVRIRPAGCGLSDPRKLSSPR